MFKNFELFINGIESEGFYSFIRFNKPIHLTKDFFNKPASYRYVDGKNSFYLINKNQMVFGVLRNRHPENYNIIDRCVGKHIEKLIRIPCFRWISFVGLNNDLNIFCKNNIFIKWAKNKWQVREKSLILNELLKIGVDNIFAEQLCDIVFALSELRMGALLLIQEGENSPRIIGKIDKSPLGNELYSSMCNISFNDLFESNSILGVLSSDGLTTFNKLGHIIDCGAIIDLNSDGKSLVTGGGRSQAANAASQFGLAIKISEDGPISLYYKGQEIIKL